ncbi:hypothetical protein OJ252_2145 [Cryptosporidium canis]|uniref:Uncharacterized protein n=1 Tax=Cryptosporidium canis TaxID=195482 RepID=A0ABQ8P5Z6_9CRYT|nr:hypothetical protein OJ252_2145 [Cryptosporidium canis]
MVNKGSVQAKKARSSEGHTALLEYFERLKTESLDSSHSIPPEIEDEIYNQFSKFSLENLEYLLENIVYPGVLILRNHPNALIGDVVSRIVSLNSMKTVLCSSQIDYNKFICIFDVEAWPSLEPRAICMRLSIISSIIESRAILNGVLSHLRKVVEHIFKGIGNETYFVHKSITQLVSSLIRMEVLNEFILEKFLVFQGDLILQSRGVLSNDAANRLQLYKYLFSDIIVRGFLFQSSIKSKVDLENEFHMNTGISSTETTSEFSNVIRLLAFNDEKLISNQGIELFSLALSDKSDFYLIYLKVFIREIIDFVKTFITTFSPKRMNRDSIYRFSVYLKLLNIVYGNAKTSFLVNVDLGILIAKYISFILRHHPDFVNMADFINYGILTLLLNISSSFKPFLRSSHDADLSPRKSFFNFDAELTKTELETMIKYYSHSFELNKLLLINLPQIFIKLQVAEPQIINYSTLILQNGVLCNTEAIKESPFSTLSVFMEDLLRIHDDNDLSNWQLSLLIKYLISIYSNDVAKLLSSHLHSRIVKAIGGILFTNFDFKSGQSFGSEIRKYTFHGPNVVVACAELLGLVMRVPDLDRSIIDTSFSMSEEFLRICLSFRGVNTRMVKGELFYDDHTEFFIKMVSVLRDVDISRRPEFMVKPGVIEIISDFSKRGLSPTTLDHVFFLVEMIIRCSPGSVDIDSVESLVEQLLKYHIPNEHQGGYLLFYNTYKRVCGAFNRLVNLPDHDQINEDFAPPDYTIQYRHIHSDQLCIDSIVSQFSECSLDCIGE